MVISDMMTIMMVLVITLIIKMVNNGNVEDHGGNWSMLRILVVIIVMLRIMVVVVDIYVGRERLGEFNGSLILQDILLIPNLSLLLSLGPFEKFQWWRKINSNVKYPCGDNGYVEVLVMMLMIKVVITLIERIMGVIMLIFW